MSSAAPTPTKAPPAPMAPPDDQFWERYSPHYEFPLSSVGSIAMHVAGIALFLLALWLLSRLAISDTKPVPMIGMTVDGVGSDGTGQGSGGGATPEENLNPLERPMDPSRPVPEINAEKLKELEEWMPRVPNLEEGLRPQDSQNAKKIAELNEDLRKTLLDGMSGKKGQGTGEGTGKSGAEGKGSGTSGDPTSSANRSLRWVLTFNNVDGGKYRDQLKAMDATVVIGEPPDFKTLKVYKDLANPVGEAFHPDQLKGVTYFVDSDNGPLLARALGLKYDPPLFIAIFPKHIEEELARKEREYRGRKEGEIFETTFRVLVRDGKPIITVVDQKAVRR